MAKIIIIGAGAWGTTLAQLFSENKHDVTIWCFEKEVAQTINHNHENLKYLSGIQLSERIEATEDIKQAAAALTDAAALIFVVPSEHLRKVASHLKGKVKTDIAVVSATKGIEKNSHKRISQVIAEELKYPEDKICALSGPNLSREIAKGLPATTIIAGKTEIIAKSVQELLMQPRFRVYTNQDIVGVELGGALKNIIAIAAGAADGLNLGDNAKSALLVRGIAEIARLGKALGAKPETFFGLSGFGDLVATCQSNLSRNHRVGAEIAKGKKLKEILATTSEVAEGIPTAAAVKSLAQKLKVEMPITVEVYKVLFDNKDPFQALSDLMERKAKKEDKS